MLVYYYKRKIKTIFSAETIIFTLLEHTTTEWGIKIIIMQKETNSGL
jgi:hypothetical protein